MLRCSIAYCYLTDMVAYNVVLERSLGSNDQMGSAKGVRQDTTDGRKWETDRLFQFRRGS